MFEWLYQPEAWITFLTLVLLEVVLGIDNLIFISIATAKLPKSQQNKARILGLLLAMLTRIALLFTIAWIITLTKPFLLGLSGKDIFLLLGGIFLCYKGISELGSLKFHEDLTPPDPSGKQKNFLLCLIEIALLDIVFSLDSIITAVGMLQGLSLSHSSLLFLATAAIVFTVGIMLFVSGIIAHFIHKHPNIKLLALCFLILIGGLLICDSLGWHIPKAYVYSALGFSLCVEIIRIFKKD